MPDYCIVEILCQELNITLAELMNGEEDEKSIHTYDNQNVLELLKERQQLKNKKLLLIGVVFIIMGITKLVLSQILGDTGFQAGLSGILLGVSVPEILLGIFLICFSMKK